MGRTFNMQKKNDNQLKKQFNKILSQNASQTILNNQLIFFINQIKFSKTKKNW